MTDTQRDRIVAAFERELARSPLPPELRTQAVRGAIQNRSELAPPRQQWALALVAALLAVAIVATLVVGIRALHSAPTPARHGKVIAQHHNGQIVLGQDNNLVAIDPVTGGQHTILSQPKGVTISDAAYSPDGTRLAYLRGPGFGLGDASIWILNMATGRTEQPQLLTMCHVPGCSKFSHVAWSPDGFRLAFSDGDQYGGVQLYLIDAAGTHRTQLTHFSRGEAPSQPSWSPDGTRIAFNLSTGFQQPNDLDVINIDGSGLVVLLAAMTQLNGGKLEPAWSPDGSRIAYALFPASSKGSGSDYQLWLMDSDGSHRTNIFMSPECCFRGILFITDPGAPAWSPDGTQIAIVANPPNTLWVMKADGTEARRVGDVGLGDRPTWQPVP